MGFAFASLGAVREAGFDEVIDVRSPAEFGEDHVPGAVSLPVLSDEERARVGTLYKEDPFAARKVGGALVARNAARHVETHLAKKGGGYRPLVYCWRGGMRSGSFATILRAIGWRAETVEGGYKAYRSLIVRMLYDEAFPAPVVLLGGHTGTAKTAILNRLPDHGVQALDLEGLANHRGSLFGWQGEQPSQKAFETRLAHAAAALDPGRPVVVEAESSKVGERMVPPSLWKAMRAAPRLQVEAPLAERARFTVRAYADIVADAERLWRLIDKLRPYNPREAIERWHGLVDGGAFETLATELMERHYDPRYAQQAERDGEPAARVRADDLSEAGIDALADEVRRVAEGLVGG
jgi:tRNA 2-selenouridine synthase